MNEESDPLTDRLEALEARVKDLEQQVSTTTYWPRYIHRDQDLTQLKGQPSPYSTQGGGHQG